MKRIAPVLVLAGVALLALAQTSRPASRPRSGSAPASRPVGGDTAVAAVSADGGGKAQVSLEAVALQAQGLVLTIQDGTALLAIGGPGIGKILLERKGPHWPAELRLRLTLQGLESIVLSCGGKTLSGSVSSHGDAGVSFCLLDDGKEGPSLPKSSPYWTDIIAHDASGKVVKNLPPAGGYFELVVPNALLADDAATLKLRWVDFWRG